MITSYSNCATMLDPNLACREVEATLLFAGGYRTNRSICLSVEGVAGTYA